MKLNLLAAFGAVIEINSVLKIFYPDTESSFLREVQTLANVKNSERLRSSSSKALVGFSSTSMVPSLTSLKQFLKHEGCSILAPRDFSSISSLQFDSRDIFGKVSNGLEISGLDCKAVACGEDLDQALLSIKYGTSLYLKFGLKSSESPELKLSSVPCSILDIDIQCHSELMNVEELVLQMPTAKVLVVNLISDSSAKSQKVSIAKLLSSSTGRYLAVIIRSLKENGECGVRTFAYLKHRFRELLLNDLTLEIFDDFLELRSRGVNSARQISRITADYFIPGEPLVYATGNELETYPKSTIRKVTEPVSKKVYSFGLLASSSAANCMVVSRDFEGSQKNILVDAGVRASYLRAAKKSLGINSNLVGVLLSHAHTDHCNRVSLDEIDNEGAKIYPTLGMINEFLSSSAPEQKKVERLGPYRIRSCKVVHGKSEQALAFRVEVDDFCFSYITDCGEISQRLIDLISGSDALFLEFNSRNGVMPNYFKDRVRRHLDNETSVRLLELAELSKLKLLVPLHLSLNNNSIGEVLQSIISRFRTQHSLPLIAIPQATTESGSLLRHGAVLVAGNDQSYSLQALPAFKIEMRSDGYSVYRTPIFGTSNCNSGLVLKKRNAKIEEMSGFSDFNFDSYFEASVNGLIGDADQEYRSQGLQRNTASLRFHNEFMKLV